MTAFVFAFAQVAHAVPPPGPNDIVGAVYAASNSYLGNEIVTFPRYADGFLAAPLPPVSTGGFGSGLGAVVPEDPLASQGSLIVDQERQLLFAVNAGSDDVSVFAADPAGPQLLDVEWTHGAFPVGLAFHSDTLYVLNAIDHSVAGFDVADNGTLTHLQTCALPALPAGGDPILPGTATSSTQPFGTQAVGQVGFSPDGKHLVVVSKEGPLSPGFPFGDTLGNGRVHVFAVDAVSHQLTNCAAPTTTVLPLNPEGKGKFPFSFAWNAKGNLLLTEVFGVSTSPTGSALSSFTLGADGSLTPISTSITSGQTAACWVVFSGKHAFVTNYLSDNISTYEVKNNGTLTLKAGLPESFGPGFTEFPVDLALTPDQRFLYQISPGSGVIRSFEITYASGALSSLESVPDTFGAKVGQMGLAAIDYDLD
jgi:6-phosphogluconolactonase